MTQLFDHQAIPLPGEDIIRMLTEDIQRSRCLSRRGDLYQNRSALSRRADSDGSWRPSQLHRERVGNRPTYLLRAPGRLNAFLEYLDMCDGDHMSTTIDGDIPLAVSPREDDLLNLANVHRLFPPQQLSIREEFTRFAGAPWDAATGLDG